MLVRILGLAAAALIVATPALAAKQGRLDGIARDYVRLTLEIGERDPGYVDAYYGPADWAAQAKAHPRDLAALKAETLRLEAAVKAVAPARSSPIERRRRTFLAAQLKAAETRLDMLSGTRFSFEDEAKGLFAARPTLKPLGAYDPVLKKIDALVPGEGPLWSRVEAFHDRFVIPTDKLDAVMRAAIAECRRRTVAHVALPANETFTLEFVKNQPWSGYNWYKGNATSLIQVNTDFPIRISRAVDLGCHEGYPGHHVLNMLLEEKLAKGRGWIEFTVYPLFSPQSLSAEGSANFGIDLAFPGDERRAFEAGTLYPLAGLDPAQAGRYLELVRAVQALSGTRFTIAADYLAGRIDKARALDLLQTYQLLSRPRAEQSLSFIDKYRSYVINYGLGQDMVRDHVDAAGPDPAARWKAMAAVISEPTVPADLTGGR